MDNIKELCNYLAIHKLSLLIVLLSLMGVSTSLLLIGFAFKQLIDKGLGLEQLDVITHSIYLICGLICTFGTCSFFRSYYINLISLKITSKIKSDTFSNLLKLDVSKFEELKIGDIILRLSTDIEMIGSLITNFLSFFIRNSIMLVCSLILMFIQSPKLSLMVIITIPLFLIPILKLSKHVRKLSRKVLEEQSKLISGVEENLYGIRCVYAYNKQQYLVDQFNEQIETNIKQAGVRLKLRSLFFALAISIIAASITLVIWVGSIDILNGAMTSGEMISFIYYALIVGSSAGGIAEIFNELQNPFAAATRVFELKNLKVNMAQINHNVVLNAVASIYFDKVSFSYPSRPDEILKNISFEISAGKFTGIVGKSGSGKSTLLQLLLKFYTGYTGSIFIGTNNINHIKDETIRSQIAYVEQNSTIFSGTIASNIIFSNVHATELEIKNIAQICGISEFAKELELGLDTEIGERALRISGGQKQRIAIARALLYKPEILILDEATSALDAESEEQILFNIRKYLPQKTIISIAHRISSIEKADKILVIDKGRLSCAGTHSELLKNSKIYNLLYKEQK